MYPPSGNFLLECNFPTDGRTRGTRIGDIIPSDLVGPMSVPSPSGSRYMVVFKDDFSSYPSIFFLKQKSEAFEHLKYFVLRLEKETNHSVNIFRSENGEEYTEREFEYWIKSKGIRHETSIPKTPQQMVCPSGRTEQSSNQQGVC